jgi:hypothetical protein
VIFTAFAPDTVLGAAVTLEVAVVAALLSVALPSLAW